MKELIIKNSCLLFTLGVLLISGCIDDNIAPPLTGDLNTTAEILVYLESRSDFPNSYLAPALIDAEEVFANLNSYLLIDIRPNDEFAAGHIENSLNISLDSLFNFVEMSFNSGYPKIIIISKNGQSSSYFTCLLRLAGFDNVYTMSFGMASWNEVFADEWLNALGNDPEIAYYQNNENPKNDFSSLPNVTFENSDAHIKDRVKERIKKIISLGFKEEVQFRKVLTFLPSDYLVCYGKTGLLYYARRQGPLPELGHHERAIFYQADPLYELRSTEFLQTLPNNKTILIYDGTGELSASMAAFLRILGYDAQTLLFGVNQLFYDRVIYYPELIEFAFSNSRIKNYPYITAE
ncbi:MAG: rhodanese-like domain-containing protein [Ignavibacteriaceae bacterium]